MIESRYSKRMPNKLFATVDFDYESRINTLTLDVNKRGLFLKLRHPKLTNNMIIDIILYDSQTTLPWNTRAMVVHMSRHGVGVLLEKDLPDVFCQVREKTHAKNIDYKLSFLTYSKEA